MSKNIKVSILKALSKGHISKVEALNVLRFGKEGLIFKTIIYPNGEAECLSPKDHSLIPLLEKSGIDFIHIKRRVIK